MVTDEDIKKLAFNIWEEEGRPDGKDLEHFLKAKKILEEREANRIIELAPALPAVELAQPGENILLPKGRTKRNIRDQHKKKS